MSFPLLEKRSISVIQYNGWDLGAGFFAYITVARRFFMVCHQSRTNESRRKRTSWTRAKWGQITCRVNHQNFSRLAYPVVFTVYRYMLRLQLNKNESRMLFRFQCQENMITRWILTWEKSQKPQNSFPVLNMRIVLSCISKGDMASWCCAVALPKSVTNDHSLPSMRSWVCCGIL